MRNKEQKKRDNECHKENYKKTARQEYCKEYRKAYKKSHPYKSTRPLNWKAKTKDPNYSKNYYLENKNKVKLWARNYRIKRGVKVRPLNWVPKKKTTIDFIYNFKKEKSCEHCGYNEHPQILQFHHKNGDKKFEISVALHKGAYSIEEIKKEITKCEILCPNCHFWLHSKEGRNIL